MDTADRVADAPGGVAAALQLTSHIVLLFAALVAYRRRHWMLLANVSGVLLCSILYHLCRTDIACAFGLLLDQWRRADHFAALLLPGGLALTAVRIAHPQETRLAILDVASYFLPVYTLLVVEAFPFQARSAILVIFYCLGVALAVLTAGPPDTRRFRGGLFAATIVFLVVGLVGYLYDSGSPRGDQLIDAIMHSIWHMAIGAAVICFTEALHPEDTAREHS